MDPLDLQRISPKPTQKMTSIEDLWKLFIQLKGNLAPGTLAKHASLGKKFCGFLINGERPLTKSTMIEWMQFLLGSGVGPNLVNENNYTIKTFLRFLKRSGYIQEDLADLLTPVKGTPPSDSKTFTEAEFNTIKAYCTGREWCQCHLWLIILAYRTGMSLVDCCHLRWANVTLDDNGPSFITIQRIKMASRTITKCHIPILPGSDVHQWMIFLKNNTVRYKRHDGIDDFVHQDAPGLYACTFSTIKQDFKNIFIRCGIGKERSFKHFRNSFCSNLINSGTQIALICKMTGHQNVTTLLRYLKPDTRSLQDGLAKAFQFAAGQGDVGARTDGLTFDKPNE